MFTVLDEDQVAVAGDLTWRSALGYVKRLLEAGSMTAVIVSEKTGRRYGFGLEGGQVLQLAVQTPDGEISTPRWFTRRRAQQYSARFRDEPPTRDGYGPLLDILEERIDRVSDKADDIVYVKSDRGQVIRLGRGAETPDFFIDHQIHPRYSVIERRLNQLADAERARRISRPEYDDQVSKVLRARDARAESGMHDVIEVLRDLTGEQEYSVRGPGEWEYRTVR